MYEARKIEFDESKLSPNERKQMDHLIRQLPKQFRSQFTPEEQDKIHRAYRCEGWWRSVARNTGWGIGTATASFLTARLLTQTRKFPPFLSPGFENLSTRSSAWRYKLIEEARRTLPRRELGFFRGWGAEVGVFGSTLLLIGYPLSRFMDTIGHFGGHLRYLHLLHWESGFCHNQIGRAAQEAHEATMREYLDLFRGDLDVGELRVRNAHRAEDGSFWTLNIEPTAFDSKGNLIHPTPEEAQRIQDLATQWAVMTHGYDNFFAMIANTCVRDGAKLRKIPF